MQGQARREGMLRWPGSGGSRRGESGGGGGGRLNLLLEHVHDWVFKT